MSSKPGLSCNHSNKSKHDHLPCQERPDIAKIDTVKTPSEKPRQAITVRLDAALVERLRTFCRDQAGKPIYATVNGIVGQAVERELARLERGIEGAPLSSHTIIERDDLPAGRRVHLNNQR